MKTKLFTLVVLFCMACLSGCKKEDSSFNYPIESLYGIWDGTEFVIDNQTIAVTDPHNSFALEFRTDGTCIMTGYLGAGTGTFSTSGYMIHTSLADDFAADYDVFVLTNTQLELRRHSTHLPAITNIRLKKR